MHVFYTPDIQTHAELPEEEAAHAVRVLRLQAGDEVMLTDGKGCFYRAEISTATNKRCRRKHEKRNPFSPQGQCAEFFFRSVLLTVNFFLFFQFIHLFPVNLCA